MSLFASWQPVIPAIVRNSIISSRFTTASCCPLLLKSALQISPPLFRNFRIQTPPHRTMSESSGASVAIFGAGCFWGVEKIFRKQFLPQDGLLDVKVGYTGGHTDNPSYKAVCSGQTGHVEAVRLEFNPDQLPYKRLVEFFFRIHDPTTESRQGADVGPQYSSVIVAQDESQRRDAEDIIQKVKAADWFKGKPIVTKVLKAGPWWNAEEYHQQYLDKNPYGYECPNHFIRAFAPLDLD